MGYVNYWTPENVHEKFSKDFIKYVKKIISESGVPIKNHMGNADADPIITQKRIAFNGLDDSGHEAFVLFPRGLSRSFCKTNRKPYDIVVKAILMLAEQCGYISNWRFDGEEDEQEYVDAKKLYDSVMLGMDL